MRLWSIHPRYLDRLGLLALWREGLGALAVIGTNRGYSNHPQLKRFNKELLACYMYSVYEESVKRGYNFNIDKLPNNISLKEISITHGQLEYEAKHLLTKLEIRDKEKYKVLKNDVMYGEVKQHPIFKMIDGDIEDWERVV